MARKVLMQGNEACVEGAIAAGCNFFAGYPITPSTEIAEGCARRLPQEGGRFIQMEDELSSMAAVIGASAAGAKAMTATSGPGFSLMQENLGYACLAEVPCVVVDVQRGGPSTGLPTSPSQGDYQQARWGTHGDHPVIAISPSGVQEAYTLAIRCFNLAEKYRTPVIFLMDEIVGHMREGIQIPEKGSYEIVRRKEKESVHGEDRCAYHVEAGEWVPSMLPFGCDDRYNMTGLIHDDEGFPTNSNQTAGTLVRRLLDKIEKNRDDIIEVEEYEMDDADVAVIAYGGTARAAVDAVHMARKKGIKAGLWRPVTVWPFPDEQLSAMSGRVRRIVMAEHNDGQMLREVKRNAKCPVDFIGRIDGTVIPPEEIEKKLEESGHAE